LRKMGCPAALAALGNAKNPTAAIAAHAHSERNFMGFRLTPD